jgi:hypothetical protein
MNHYKWNLKWPRDDIDSLRSENVPAGLPKRTGYLCMLPERSTGNNNKCKTMIANNQREWPTTWGTSAERSSHNWNPSHTKTEGGEEHLKTGDNKNGFHWIPISEGCCSSCTDFIRNERLLTETMVGCLEVGGRILSELFLEAICSALMRRCS